jgi:thiol:disulfide interchange protein DsbC
MNATAFIGGRARALVASLLILLSADLPAAEADFPRDALKGIDAMRRLPADGFHVVESQGRLLLVSTNGHYVVTGGRILDLWNQVEVRSVADVDGTLRLPLARMGIDAKALGGLIAGQESAKQRVTAFLDPGSAESRKLLPLLRELAPNYRLDLIFVPAQPQRAGISRALICDRQAALAFFNEARAPAALPDSNSCGEKELERARVTVHLLGITSLPFTVSPNGATVAGIPKNYAAFVTANQESSP